MAATRIVVDGLWRCLCPSVDTPALLRAINSSSTATVPAAQSALRQQHTPRLRAGRGGQRLASHSARHIRPCLLSPPPPQSRRIHAGAASRVGRLELVSTRAADGTLQPPPLPPKPELSDEKALVHLLRARPPCWAQLQAASTPVIYEALRQLQNSSACGLDKIEAMVRFLLEERKEPLSAALCEAVLQANCSRHGSAEAVRDVLQLIKASTIEATAGLFHVALAVLAVHPDYLTRAAVLAEMKERWIDVSADGMYSVALGLLRDGQYERAIEQLDTMTAAAGGAAGGAATATAAATAAAGAAAPPPWLLDIYVYVFLQEGFVDDALKIIDQRVLMESDLVTPNLWFVMLEACCRWSHYEGLVYVWNRAVRSASGRSILTPSDAMALDILNIAAQHGDSNLAAAVMQMLAARGTKLGLPHFEAMLDCYCRAGHVAKALQVLCIMNNAHITPDQATTRSLFLRLVESGDEAVLHDAVDSLFSLKKQYGSVPLAAFNVVIEAMLELDARPDHGGGHGDGIDDQSAQQHEPAADSRGVLMALDLYRHVRQLCPAGPSRATFRLLFGACTNPQHLHFLLREMQSFGLRADIAYVSQVVQANAAHGSLDAAISHVHALMDADEIAPMTAGDAARAAATTEADHGMAAGEEETTEEEEEGADPAASLVNPSTTTTTTTTTTSDTPVYRNRPWISRRAATALVRRCVEEKDDRIRAIAAASRRRGRPMDKILAMARRGPANKPVRSNAYGVPHMVEQDESA